MTQTPTAVTSDADRNVVRDGEPEGMVQDLVLADHQKGYWPSSKNVTQ